MGTMYKTIKITIWLIVCTGSTFSASDQLTGVITGHIRDSQTHELLAGANIMIVNSPQGAASDLNGYFKIEGVRVGNHTLQISYIGYVTYNQPDVIVKPARSTTVDINLQTAISETDVISVSSSFFNQAPSQPVSTTSFSREEIRRTPGTGGDVSRIVMGLPSIAKVNDQNNSLIVRGGSPIENSFYIDHIEIPNINHFPTQGSSGGPIGILNVDFIRKVDFYSGGFSASYGDRLSSIMNVKFREGNRDHIQGQLDFNFAGFGGLIEGPISGNRGSWMISARRSYLDFLIKLVDAGTSLAPSYGDIQAKLVYDLGTSHTLSVLGILADSHSKSDRITAEENAMLYFGNQDYYEGTIGLNWQILWTKTGYTRTVLSFNIMDYNDKNFDLSSDNILIDNKSREQILNLSNHNYLQFSDWVSVEFGINIKQYYSRYDTYYGESTNFLGNQTPAVHIDLNKSALKSAIYINNIFNLWQAIDIKIGLRAEYFSANSNSNFAPRIALSYKIAELTTINAAAGTYYQNLPLNLMAQSIEYTQLHDMRSDHIVFGVSQLLTESTRLTLEAYQKTYQNFPMDPTQPGFFIIDELFYNYGFFTQHEKLTDSGKAWSKGVEIILQKKLATDFYGMISGSYFRARYQNFEGIWRDRIYDNRLVFNIEGGYKPNNEWEFSMRWIFAGGIPFTPFDMSLSSEYNKGILDEKNINGGRHTNYHSLNIRCDRRFHFTSSNIVIYLSVWNTYNRKNVASFYWNTRENQPDTMYQWGLLPIFGVEYEF
jgi:hypothetical protein